MGSPTEITTLLALLQEGRQDAWEQLYRLAYDELRRIARSQLRRLRPGQTLDTTALVHEAYLRLVDQTHTKWQDRAHFFAVSAVAMRRILINYAERQRSLKRGGGWERVDFDDARIASEERALALLNVDAALTRLAALDERLSRVVEYRFFGGMTESEIAAVLHVTERTVRRDWQKAKGLLKLLLDELNI
jgi:RNA polymerase sigma factor (TIGR02999 family)